MLTLRPAVPRQQTGCDEEVRLRVAAVTERIPLVRGLAGDLAAREEFDVDRVEDFRLAVEEACAVLIRNAEPGAALACSFHVAEDRLRLRLRTVTRHEEPDRDSFGWHVLETLSDSVRLVVDPPSPSTGLGTLHLEIDIRKHPARRA